MIVFGCCWFVCAIREEKEETKKEEEEEEGRKGRIIRGYLSWNQLFPDNREERGGKGELEKESLYVCAGQ